MKENIAQDQKLPFAPSDELQLYYNDAYMKERERFNNIFGVIDEDALAPNKVETVYIEPSPDKFVTMAKFKKAKKKINFFVITTLIFAGISVFYILKTQGII
jgi:hypothetical protein